MEEIFTYGGNDPPKWNSTLLNIWSSDVTWSSNTIVRVEQIMYYHGNNLTSVKMVFISFCLLANKINIFLKQAIIIVANEYYHITDNKSKFSPETLSTSARILQTRKSFVLGNQSFFVINMLIPVANIQFSISIIQFKMSVRPIKH